MSVRNCNCYGLSRRRAKCPMHKDAKRDAAPKLIRIKLDEAMLAKLQKGEGLSFKIPGMAIRLSVGEDGDFELFGGMWDKMWKEFDAVFDKFDKIFKSTTP